MWICPVCNRKNEENLLCCPACSFDASSNYENFNTLNSLAEGTAAISRRKESAIESTIKSSNRIDWPNVTAVAQCLWHTVVLYRDGRTAAFGDNDMDQCEVSEWNHITAIAAGGSPTGTAFTLGLHADGTVVAAGRLGISRKRISRCVSEWTNTIAIAAGGNHMVGLRSDGTVIAAGDNIHGQCEVSDWENITAIACGALHTVGLKADGTVVTTDEDYDLSDWKNITAIACGPLLTVGLRADGTIVAADDNGEYDFRDQKNIIKIACAAHLIFGLRADNTLLIINCMIDDEPETKETDTGNDDILRDCIREALEKVDISPKAEPSESAQEQKSTAEGSKKEETPQKETVDDDLLKAFRDSLMALGFAKSEE